MQAVLLWWVPIQNGSPGPWMTVRNRGPCWPVMGMSQRLLLIIFSHWNLRIICYCSVTQPLLTDRRTKALGRHHGQWCIFLALKHSKFLSYSFLSIHGFSSSPKRPMFQKPHFCLFMEWHFSKPSLKSSYNVVTGPPLFLIPALSHPLLLLR